MSDVVIVDASVALKWVINGEDSDRALALLGEWITAELLLSVPALFAFEVTNALYQYVRAGQMTLEEAKTAQSALMKLVDTGQVLIEPPPSEAMRTRALQLAQEFHLRAAYDAYYLALAEREGSDLWTADQRLYNTVHTRMAMVRLLAPYQPPSQANQGST
jgi:predicted nucleic acid-binding protein